MTLERLTTKELQSRSIEAFYDFMASDTEKFMDYFILQDLNPDYPTPMDMLYKETKDTLDENAARIELFEQHIKENKGNEAVINRDVEEIALLKEERVHVENSSMSYMKELFKKTGKIDYARSIVLVPLDKKINSFYDDFVLEVVFYDDIGVIKGKYDEYRKLKTFDERRAFIKANTEITHMALLILNSSRSSLNALIPLYGKYSQERNDVSSGSITVLPEKFSDFNQITLAETIEVTENNDLRQFLQTKIDLDKENLELLADLDIRGSNYKLYKYESTDEEERDMMFIRYVCPSTGRVYFNLINKSFLEFSEFYEKDNYESYLEAWWNVCHVGADPREGRMARC